jgi:hypothetical protein
MISQSRVEFFDYRNAKSGWRSVAVMSSNAVSSPAQGSLVGRAVLIRYR